MAEINHWIVNEISEEVLKQAEEIVNKKRFEKKIFRRAELSKEEQGLLEKILEVYELAIIDLWNSKNSQYTFSVLSKKCSDILQIIPIPLDDIEKIKHILKFMIYSYLGKKWESAKRFLIEEDVWKIKVGNEDSWDRILLKKTFLATLYLLRKNSQEDLNKVIKLINELHEEQKVYEKKYLESVELEFKKGAVLELASFYHYAKSIEILGKFMLEGEPNSERVLSELEYHLEKAIKFCDVSGNFEFFLIFQGLLTIFKKIVFISIRRIMKEN